MSKFISGASKLVSKTCKTATLMKEIESGLELKVVDSPTKGLVFIVSAKVAKSK